MRYRFLRFPGGKAKAVTFSYDDGDRGDLRLAKTINEHGIKCTFNINSGFIGTKPDGHKLTKDDIQKYILDAGHEVAVHGEVHRAPGKVRAIECITDALNCRLQLEEMFGRIIRGMAYPDSGITKMMPGASYENIRQYLKDLEIVYARTLGKDNDSFMLPDDWYAWMPTAHHVNPKAIDYAKKFVEMDVEKLYIAETQPRLYYLWGHTFEFDRNNNWELLDELCGILGGHDDIWYATNIEIYDYVTAYNSLVYSADSTRVYNPTLIDVWFVVDGKLYEVKSGEEIRVAK
ncbi:MAG: polysaccharide deacetylase family protein [Tyzzerella sp.]|nr:polysaccharide deacetylase family protein [Tyzzerella sp.]